MIIGEVSGVCFGDTNILREVVSMRGKTLLIGVSAVSGLGVGAALAFLICALGGGPAYPAGPNGGVPREIEIPSENAVVYAAAMTAARAIYEADFAALGALAHPEQGCVFVPYSTVDRGENPVFMPAQIGAMGEDRAEYVWDGPEQSGQPLSMTPAVFFRDILQIRDFSAAPTIGFDMVLRTGNAVENVLEEYPEAHIVDLYCPDPGKDPAGADWASLKLVFEDWDGELKLVAVVRSVYTEQ